MKFNIDQAHADRNASIARRAATRKQIVADQQADAKRDAAAIRAEAAWYRRQAKLQG